MWALHIEDTNENVDDMTVKKQVTLGESIRNSYQLLGECAADRVLGRSI